MKYALFLLVFLFIPSCVVNTRCVDYMIVTKTNNTKDTIKYEYWNEFEMDDAKLEWMLMNKGINIKDVKVVDFIQGPRTRFNKHYQLK
jgi:hypothetical protein